MKSNMLSIFLSLVCFLGTLQSVDADSSAKYLQAPASIPKAFSFVQGESNNYQWVWRSQNDKFVRLQLTRMSDEQFLFSDAASVKRKIAQEMKMKATLYPLVGMMDWKFTQGRFSLNGRKKLCSIQLDGSFVLTGQDKVTFVEKLVYVQDRVYQMIWTGPQKSLDPQTRKFIEGFWPEGSI